MSPAEVATTQAAGTGDLGSIESEDGQQGVIDSPHLLRGEVTDQPAEATVVDGANLFNEHSRRLSGDVGLGPKGGGPSASGCRGDDDDRARKEFVGLHNDAVAVTVLFVAKSRRKTESVDVTAEHEALP
jgi:hypothetical protein